TAEQRRKRLGRRGNSRESGARRNATWGSRVRCTLRRTRGAHRCIPPQVLGLVAEGRGRIEQFWSSSRALRRPLHAPSFLFAALFPRAVLPFATRFHAPRAVNA